MAQPSQTRTPLKQRCINTRAAAAYLGVTIAALRAWRLRGLDDRNTGPPYIRVSPTLILYDIDDLDDWLERKRSSTHFDTHDRAGAGGNVNFDR